jgi:hypothetical protein
MNTLHQTGRGFIENLEIGVFLGFGIWDLDFGISLAARTQRTYEYFV